MLHRHLNHQNLSLAAIDDVIARGGLQDWAQLRKAVLEDRDLMAQLEQICKAHTHDPYAQRYYFWQNYANEHRAAT